MSLELPASATVVRVIAGVTLRRAFRSLLLVSVLCAVLPAIYALLSRDTDVDTMFTMETLLLGIVTPLLVGWPIGEEIDDKTATYLWARPIERWTILAGKLIALAPIVFGVFMLGWLAVAGIIKHGMDGQIIAALGRAVVAMSCTAAGLAMLLPKHPLLLSLIVLAIIDQTIGAMPGGVHNAAISHQARVMAGASEGNATTAAIVLLVISAFWLYIGLWRIKKTQL